MNSVIPAQGVALDRRPSQERPWADIDFACPSCKKPVDYVTGAWECAGCGGRYPVDGGLHRFFVDPAPGVASEMRQYTDGFRTLDAANKYARSFVEHPRLRRRTRNEIAVLADLVGSDPGARILNVPCGAGRLSAPLRRPGTVLLEADSSPGQLHLNRQRFGDVPDTVWLTASAFDLPLPDGAVDTVVCARLSHHLHRPVDRERLLIELLRVARRRLVFSFRNVRSLPALSRRLRGRAIHATVMSIDEVESCAARHGARLERWRSVSNLGARHTYALLSRDA